MKASLPKVHVKYQSDEKITKGREIATIEEKLVDTVGRKQVRESEDWTMFYLSAW